MTELILNITNKHRKSLVLGLSVFVNHIYFNRYLKSILEYLISVISIILLIPAFLCIGIIIKLTSKGKIIYKQKRIGKNGKTFLIYKFRSMYNDAEKNGPLLSTQNDKRITKIGKILRKTRLDEIPQFINVLKGDMSIVGYRPERQFYINQIIKTQPEFIELLEIKPGITSLGQVEYGYAENINQMLQRLKFDLYYVRNKSLILDFNILLKTITLITKTNGT